MSFSPSSLTSENLSVISDSNSSTSSDVFFPTSSFPSKSAEVNKALKISVPQEKRNVTEDIKNKAAESESNAIPEFLTTAESSSKATITLCKRRSQSTYDIPSSTNSKESLSRRGASFYHAFSPASKFLTNIRRSSKSTPTTPQRSIHRESNEGRAPWAGNISKDKRNSQSFYKSFEDLKVDAFCGVEKRECRAKIETLHTVFTTYKGGVQCEIGPCGGLIRVPGTDVSLHVSQRKEEIPVCQCTCINATSDKRQTKTFNKNRHRASSKIKKLQGTPNDFNNFTCPGVDKLEIRMMISLEDPPPLSVIASGVCVVNVKTIAHIGAAIRIDFLGNKLQMHDVAVQMAVNANASDLDKVLKKPTGKKVDETCVSKFCKMIFMQSGAKYGPFEEIRKCFSYGNTLQATIDPRNFKGSNPSQVYLVPIAKICESSAPSPWNFITCKGIKVSVYGPRNIHATTHFCVSVSTVDFSPPSLSLQHSQNKNQLMQRWDCFMVSMQQFQKLELTITSDSDSFLLIDSGTSKYVIAEDELCRNSRINLTCTLHCSRHECKSFVKAASRGIVIKMLGARDKVERRMPFTAPSPGEFNNLSNDALSTTATFFVANELKEDDLTFLWQIFQEAKGLARDEMGNLKERKVCTPFIAVALKNNKGKEKSFSADPTFLGYSQGDFLAILNSQKLTLAENDSTADFWTAYSQHKIGLVHVNKFQTFSFDEFCLWDKARLDVRNIVESATESVERLNCLKSTLQLKLTEKVRDWKRFTDAMDFGVTFVEQATSEERSVKQRSKMLAFFFQKYEEYCTSGPCRKSFHREIVKALLYAEEYVAAVDLVVDSCLFTVSLVLLNKWTTLTENLEESMDNEEILNKSLDAKQEPWKSALRFLQQWRGSMLDDKHFLQHLYEVLGRFEDFPRKTLNCITGALTLLTSIQSLCCFDTRL